MRVEASTTATAVAVDHPSVGADVLANPMDPDLLRQEAASTRSGPLRVDTSSPERSLGGGAGFREADYLGSGQFRNRWRWPFSYRSIEGAAIIVDILIILSSGVIAASG